MLLSIGRPRKAGLVSMTSRRKAAPNRPEAPGELVDPMGNREYHQCSPVRGWTKPMNFRSSGFVRNMWKNLDASMTAE